MNVYMFIDYNIKLYLCNLYWVKYFNSVSDGSIFCVSIMVWFIFDLLNDF